MESNNVQKNAQLLKGFSEWQKDIQSFNIITYRKAMPEHTLTLVPFVYKRSEESFFILAKSDNFSYPFHGPFDLTWELNS